MAYTLLESAGHGRMRDFGVQVVGGLEARPALAAEAGPWHAMVDRIVAERAASERARDAVTKASTLVRVEDVDFDVTVGDVSSTSYHLSGKKVDREPYSVLFGRIKATQAKKFGRAKAVEVGVRVVRDGRRLEVPELGASLDRLDTATGALTAASAKYDEAEDALFDVRRAKARLLRDINDLIAVTEARILTVFPGRDDLVAAILRPWHLRSRVRSGGSGGADGGDGGGPDEGGGDDDLDEDLLG